MKKLLVFFLLLGWIIAPLCSQNYLDSLDQTLMQVAMQEGVAGFGAALLKHGEVLYARGFGYSDINNKKSYTKASLQNIGSISKTFIGIAIMKAVEEGKVSLDSKINDFLPFEINHPYHSQIPITLKHLATHTSGIKDGQVYEKAYVIAGKSELKEEQVPKNTWKEFQMMKEHQAMSMGAFFERVLKKGGDWYKKKNFYKHAPGSKYEYSNIGAALAAFVLEQATGESFESYTRKNILEPIGMKSSGWHFNEVDMHEHSQLYFKNHVAIPRYFLITYPDGGFLTNIHDISLYLAEAMKGYAGKGSLLSSNSYQEMMKLHTRKEDTYGIFWEITEDGKIGHNGGDPGVFTYIQFDPKTQVGRIIFTNTDIDSKSNSLNQMRTVWRALLKYGELHEMNGP